MCKVIEDMRNEAVKVDRERMALAMIKDGNMPLELIAKYSGLTLKQVEELSKKKST